MNERLSDRELDALVAEKVMGWREVWFDRYYHDDEVGWSQYPAESKEACRHTPVAYWEDPGGCAVNEVEEWLPSTEIQSAMEVVEKMRASNIEVSISLTPKAVMVSLFDFESDGPGLSRSLGATTEDESLPRAICLAALSTVEDKSTSE